MGHYRATFGRSVYGFSSLKDLLAKATPLRSGDQLAHLAAASAEERIAAQTALADVPLKAFLDDPLIPYESDEVTRLIFDSHDVQAFAPIAHLTVGDFRNWLLSHEADGATLAKLAAGLMPEQVAAVSKIMREQDLIQVARKIRVVTRFRTTVGLAGTLSTRLQPNHPSDDPQAITASIIDGLMLESGDAVIGINPVSDNPERLIRLLQLIESIRLRYAIPVQSCVLAHLTTQMEAMRAGAAVDLVFQSIGGTEATNSSFGITLAIVARGQPNGAGIEAWHGGPERHVFRDGAGKFAIGQCPSWCGPANL